MDTDRLAIINQKASAMAGAQVVGWLWGIPLIIGLTRLIETNIENISTTVLSFSLGYVGQLN